MTLIFCAGRRTGLSVERRRSFTSALRSLVRFQVRAAVQRVWLRKTPVQSLSARLLQVMGRKYRVIFKGGGLPVRVRPRSYGRKNV